MSAAKRARVGTLFLNLSGREQRAKTETHGTYYERMCKCIGMEMAR